MKIVVLGGGISTERHVALVTATSVCRALRRRGHKAIFVDLFLGLENWHGSLEEAFEEPYGFCGQVAIETEEPDLKAVWAARRYPSKGHLGKNVAEICALADCVFLGLHGIDGEDGKIQALLELIGVPYTGSGPLASAVAMDKAMAKRILESHGVLTPAWRECVITEENVEQLAQELPVPGAVKIVNGGSSIGVELPETREELREALKRLVRYGSRFVAEEKIYGRELTVPVLNGKALSPIEIVPPEGMGFDYVAKYQSGALGASEICPADLTEEEDRLLRKTAEQVHSALNLQVYSRSDYILDAAGRAWFLEVNTLPGMTPNSLIPKAAAVEGMSYDELCEEIVMSSLKVHRA
ncbi:MAG: D-alanine--D-alanine ligase [Oscillospiraceae bacterium]|nr:D-alanine--D-alanine ligase [Oscillospiraceae bacterium]